MNPIIVCGDSHADPFWKNGLDYFYSHPECKFIFLGDYLDPYPQEGFTKEDAIENFKEILQFARENRDRVILLLGNHDFWALDSIYDSCRHDYKNWEYIHQLFEENEDLFKVAHLEENYLFTHAGVTKGWLIEHNLQDKSIEELVDYMNEDYDNVWHIGFSRGGWFENGSPIWACLLGDWIRRDCSNPFNGITQCFSHTRLEKGMPYHDEKKNIYMMDVRNCFLLENDEFILLSPEN